MHIVGLLVAAIIGVAVWYWRLKMLHEAGSEVIDSVERMRGAYRRRQFRNKVESAPLTAIEEPAIAAVAFYFCLAEEKPIYKDQATEAIRQRMTGIIAAKDIDEVLVFAEWAAKAAISPQDVIRRFRKLWTRRLNRAELGELMAIAEAVADVGGGPNDEQRMALQTLKRSLLN